MKHRPTCRLFLSQAQTHTHAHTLLLSPIHLLGRSAGSTPPTPESENLCVWLSRREVCSLRLPLKIPLTHSRTPSQSADFFFKVRSSFSLFLPPPSEKVKGEWSPLDGAGIEIGLSRTEEGESCPAHPGQHKSAKQRDLSGSGKDHHLWTVPMTTTHTTTRGKTTDTCKYRTRWRMKTFEFPEISFFFRLFWFTEY